MHTPFLLTATFLTYASCSVAQFVNQDPKARNLTVVKSPADNNITVSYKSPDGACTTAFESQQQYTGWVNIPGDYPTNLFFWFVEAREPTSTLTIWLNGGPGSSSMYGFFGGNGPCEVVEKGLDEYETVAREWGWDRASNMLFIDQPNQVGYSYDQPRNGTFDFINGTIEEPPVRSASGYRWASLNGTFSTADSDNTVNTTELAATAVWHLLQGVLSSLPQYQSPSSQPMEVNLFAESYGGRYGPIFAETFEEQNQKRQNGTLDPDNTLEVRLVSLGIVNGCIDQEIQVPQYPIFATNNTYDFQAISKTEAQYYLDAYSAAGGCGDLLRRCKAAVAQSDPDGEGDEAQVNSICSNAQQACDNISTPYYNSGRSPYDLAAPYTDPFPSVRYVEYLNNASVQQAIGSPVNFTTPSVVVFSEFHETGDESRGGNVPRLAALVKRGIRVGLMYGDRDYICNWFGGQAVAERVAQEIGGEYGENFINAGYAPIQVNDSYIGGVVRQYGNLSFSRIYQAGHAVPAYQPETAFQVFARIIAGSSVATGDAVDLAVYNTTGAANATETASLPKMPKSTCFVRELQNTCDENALKLLSEDKGVIINGVLYSSSQDWPLYTASATSSASSESATATGALTGQYTATAMPENKENVAKAKIPISWQWYIALLVGQVLWLL